MAYDETIDGPALKLCMHSAQFNTLEAAELYETPEYRAYNCSTCGLYHLHEIEEE